MNLDRSKSLVAVLLLIFSGFTGVMLLGTGGTGGAPAEPYHNSFIHFDVEQYDGAPADGFKVSWSPRHAGGLYSGSLDASGEGMLNLSFGLLGDGILRIRDIASRTYYVENINIGPDEVLYRNLTLPRLNDRSNLVTGILRDGDTLSPIPGAYVRIYTTNDLGDNYYLLNITDTEGRYSLYLPNMTRYMFQVQVYEIAGYRPLSRAILMKEGVNRYDVDLYAFKTFSGDLDCRVRYINTSTGEPMFGFASISSRATGDDLGIYDPKTKAQDTEGWIVFNGSFGEATVNFYPEAVFGHLSFYIFTSLIINSTGIDLEVPVDLSFLVPVRIDVKNSTSSIEGAQVNYYIQGYREFGQFAAEYYNYTNENGTIFIYLPAGEVNEVVVYDLSHMGETVKVDTTGPGPYEIDVTLDPLGTVTPPPDAMVNITVLDDITGIPVPDAYIRGWMDLGYSVFDFDAFTGSDGKYSGMVPSGTYDYIVAYSNLVWWKLDGPTISPAGPNDVIIRAERRVFPGEKMAEDQYFMVKDPDGQPVPGAAFMVYSEYSSLSSYGTELISDDQGRVDLKALDGGEVTVLAQEYLISGKLNPWAMQTTQFTPQAGAPYLGDITVYPRPDPATITGFIRDAYTMEPLMYGTVRAHSVRVLDEVPSRIMMGPEFYLEGVEYMDQYRIGTVDGYYRNYGVETVILEVNREGYFFYQEELTVEPTRADIVHDILMDPLPDLKAWLNGTLVDGNGDPIPGGINITDIDHPGSAGYDLVIDGTGAFSIELWPSTYRLRFFNETLEGTMDVILTEDGIEGLELKLIPLSEIAGKVLDWQGSPIEGINVTLVLEPEETLVDWYISETDGMFSFEVPSGTYSILIAMSDLYSDYRVNDITVNGWDDWYNSLYLNNRTQGDVSGTVLGSDGPYASGVPGVRVSLMSGETEAYTATTDSLGRFEMTLVNYGIYDLVASPPESLMPVEDLRSGYLPNMTVNITIEGPMTLMEPVLTYVEHTPPGYVNITYYSPNGTDIYLNGPIVVSFSEVMNRSATEDSIIISPEITGTSYHWDEWGYTLTVLHDDLAPNTAYTVTVGLSAVSFDGWPLWEGPFSWEFTTGETIDPWTIYTADVVLTGMNLSVEVTAPANQTIYLGIAGLDYYKLVEDAPGNYSLDLDETNFEHETTYGYFFTDRLNGYDKAPGLAGTFTTPKAPVVTPVWKLTEASVTVLVAGDWKVRAKGAENISVYLVIEGVGSFQLQESPPGTYALNVLSENFSRGETYSYHFSDREGGPDLAPEFSGTAKDPRGPTTVDEDETPWTLICLITFVIFLVIVGIVITAIVLAMKRKGTEDWGEE